QPASSVRRRGWRARSTMTWTVWLLTAALALTLLPSNVVPTAVPLLRQEWGTTDAELGGVFTAYRLGYLVAVLLILPLTDRWRASHVIDGCSAIVAATEARLRWRGLSGWPARITCCHWHGDVATSSHARWRGRSRADNSVRRPA